MLYKKYCGISMWIWILVVCVGLFEIQKIICSNKTNETFTNKDINIKVTNYNTSWCGYSKQFQAEWDEFSNLVNNDSVQFQAEWDAFSNLKKKVNNDSNDSVNYPNIDAVEVKCDKDDANKLICDNNNVKGYPWIVIDINNGTDVKNYNYNGPRTKNALLKYINDLVIDDL